MIRNFLRRFPALTLQKRFLAAATTTTTSTTATATTTTAQAPTKPPQTARMIADVFVATDDDVFVKWTRLADAPRSLRKARHAAITAKGVTLVSGRSVAHFNDGKWSARSWLYRLPRVTTGLAVVNPFQLFVFGRKSLPLARDRIRILDIGTYLFLFCV
jgi:hypothetical protein